MLELHLRPSEALDVGAGLPEKLPVLNQLLCVSFDNLTSTRPFDYNDKSSCSEAWAPDPSQWAL